MKPVDKITLLFIVLFCFLNDSLSQESINSIVPSGNVSSSLTGKGKVYFIRHTGHEGSAVTFKAVVDKEVVCKLNNKKYSIHELPAGEHSFSVQFSGKQAEPLTINIEEGKTYYLYMVLQPGVMKTALYCIEITEHSAKMFLEACELDNKCL
jgi:hypothetical protein